VTQLLLITEEKDQQGSQQDMKGSFSPDRLTKYGWGIPRLVGLTLFSFLFWCGDFSVLEKRLFVLVHYVTSTRFLGHAYIGSIGALVNVKHAAGLSTSACFALLLGAALFILRDVFYLGTSNEFDYTLVIYICKTFSGDFLAGKLDILEWKIALLFTFAFLLPISVLFEFQKHKEMNQVTRYSRIFVWLFVIQLICEYGDAHFEQFTLFRHRYSFEILTFLLLLWLPHLEDFELRVVQFDLVICSFYRISNFVIIIVSRNLLSKFFQSCIMLSLGVFIGRKVQIISNPEVAMVVLKSSSNKGYGLERFIASPAWLPILSLESVDGEIYKSMRSNFDKILKVLPDTSVLQEIAMRRVTLMVRNAKSSRIPIDAHILARLSVDTFCEYLGFGVDCTAATDVIANASWEWRKEIAVRGKADVNTKNSAVRVFLEELLPRNVRLFELFGTKWQQSEFYSLIMQPFLISPAINTGDICIAVKLHEDVSTLEKAIRLMHPFPIFERYVTEDIIQSGKIVVKKDTQCFMFTSDFANSSFPWAIFGAGLRQCAGMNFANIFLKTIVSECAPAVLESALFQPELGHRYSGRHLDGISSIREILYFVKMILTSLVRARVESKSLQKTERST